jgi:hypothetical protein
MFSQAGMVLIHYVIHPIYVSDSAFRWFYYRINPLLSLSDVGLLIVFMIS